MRVERRMMDIIVDVAGATAPPRAIRWKGK